MAVKTQKLQLSFVAANKADINVVDRWNNTLDDAAKYVWEFATAVSSSSIDFADLV